MPKRPITLATVLLLSAAISFARDARQLGVSQAVAVEATPVPLDPDAPERVQLGSLRYLGGVALRSRDGSFGGLSGLRWDGARLVGVSDRGNWFAMVPVERGGRLVGVRDVTMGPLRGLDGGPTPLPRAIDAEGLERLRDGSFVVSFEGEGYHRVWRYPSLDGVPTVALTSPWVERQRKNAGIETIVRPSSASDAMLLVSELRRDELPDESEALLADGASQVEGRVPRPRGFAPTDAARIDDGRLLVLYRAASLGGGFTARLWLLEGRPFGWRAREIARFDPPLTRDNLEALAVRRDGSRVLIYLASDDNFYPFQRTLLMKFELVG